MTTQTRRWLGSDAAEDDVNFKQHLVSTEDFIRLIESRYVIVSGTKGSGKSALMRALREEYGGQFAGVHGVLLSDLEFENLLVDIKRLHDASKHGLIAIARSMWQNVIGVLLLEGVLRTKLLNERDKTEIRKYLRGSSQLGTQAAEKLSGHLERVWNLIGKWSAQEDADTQPNLNALTSKQRALISSFPHDSRLEHLIALAMSGIKQTKKKFVICLDGLDSIIESSVESRDVVFAGLIDAALLCARDTLLKDALQLKVMLPRELVHGAMRKLRDLDKVEQRMVPIHWTSHSLQEFIRRRLETHVGRKGRPFDEVWREFFPDKVRNDAHGIEEDAFLYILRHTLYRPRQLLYHVQWLLEKWDEAPYAPFRLDPTFIPKNVMANNRRLTSHVIQELMMDFPHLEALLGSFRGVSCVQPWPEVKNRIDRFLNVTGTAAEAAFVDLYNYGIFGLNAHPSENHGRMVKFAFSFMNPGIERDIASKLTDKTLIALAPMVKDFCDCKTSLFGAVVPAEKA